ncbi:hypothetical protein, partial [Burkholderia ubonensis]|uniref:hypothetical protein n=1 Tax=Burkholderia ubonensis TaxID=101571 RepID=UPI0012F9FFE6
VVGTFSLPFADITGWRECCTSDLRPPRKSFDDLGISPYTRGLLMQDGNLIDASIIAIAAVYHEFQNGFWL